MFCEKKFLKDLHGIKKRLNFALAIGTQPMPLTKG